MKAIKYISGSIFLLILATVNFQIGSSTDNIKMLGIEIGLPTQTAEAKVQVNCEAEPGGICDLPYEWRLNQCNPTAVNAYAYPCEC